MPRIQHKRGTSANLTSVNPTPLAGELVWDSTENAIKIGDGSTSWTSLAYVTATPRSHVHDGGEITTGTVAYARLPVGSTTSTVCAGDDARLTDARTPTAHKASHATGGSDALTPSDIGAAPAASPAITGNATFEASSGVPLTVTNTGTGNSFVVNDASGDTTPFVVDASGNTGIGASPSSFSASFNQLVVGDGGAFKGATIYSTTQGTLAFGDTAVTTAAGYQGFVAYIHTTDYMIFGTLGQERMRIDSSGRVGINTASANASVHIKAPAAQSKGIIVERDSADAAGIDYNTTGGFVGGVYGINGGGVRLFTANGAGGTVSEAMRITPFSRVGIGTTLPESLLHVNGVITVSATSGSAGSYAPSLTFSGDSNTGFGQVSGQSDTASIFTAGHERVRVDSSGRVGIGRTPAVSGASLECAGNIYLPALKSIQFTLTNEGVGIGTPSNNGFQFWATSNSTNYFRFQGRDTTDGTFGATDIMRIVTGGTGAGNVGIQTNSPTARLDINSDTIRLRTARTPASATAAGNAGDICWDANFVYVCTATNTWRKAALTADGTQTIANDSVTYAKIQNVSTTDRLLGRSSAGAGDIEEITCTAFGRSLIDDANAAAARGTLGAAPTENATFTGTTTFNGPVKEGYVSGGNTGTAKTISLTNGTLQDYTLTGNCTFTLPSASVGVSFTLMLRTGAGGFTATFAGTSAIRWPGGVTPTATTAANRLDIFTFVSDGGKWYGAYQQNYTD